MNTEGAISIAIEDARSRHEAILNLVLITDQQAMTLLGFYLTLATATATGLAAAFAPDSPIPTIAGCALAGATMSLLIGAGLCFLAMKMTRVNAPGKTPDFWLWAITNEGVSLESAAIAYLEQLNPMQDANRALNLRTARAHWVAKIFGLAAPFVALISASTAMLFGA